ncbi:DUF1883 domain-containing protein [Nitrospirillum bahiense]|uniref:Uncharacterized protein DUF1883 n=1 Tax=Nitrospirillum amazonense TaxID=28077 RepID=A0A560G1C6_9PROT|nr:DUF1883 domain-containing protein [Nitrospirillum amazonense]TWB27703.1 uncharacterized protein DUF1883 [Nitrospirillum amazonense]
MQFTQYDLGHLNHGSVVEVVLQGNSANVRLMDSANFNSYKSGGRHSFIGGRAIRSPVRLAVPNSGTWHVAIDMQGLRGSVRTAIRVIPG